LKDVSTHQRKLDLEERASRNLGFSPSDLKSYGPIFSSYGGRKEMRLVGIESSRQDLQLSFRGRKQITKFRGSKIRVKISGERILGFRERNLDPQWWGLYIEGWVGGSLRVSS
jgi:hypothetical protein